MNQEELASRRKRLCLAASQRGLLEVELALAPLVAERMASLSEGQLDCLEMLLAMEDLDLWEVICRRREAPEDIDPELLDRLRGGLAGHQRPGAD